jgi:uncharacterized membrane protein
LVNGVVFNVAGARYDRASGLPDKNKKMIYENDRAQWERWTGTVVMEDGAWVYRIDGSVNHPLIGMHDLIEVIGLVPWEENHENH